MSIGLLLLIIGLALILLTAYNGIGLLLLIVGVILLVVGPGRAYFDGRRGV